MNERLLPSHIVLRILLDSLLFVSALTLPLPYVVVLGALSLIGFGMYEGVVGGLLFDAVHTALSTNISIGELPITALFLVFLTLGLIGRRTLFFVQHR
jgi:hypothetical protein